MKNLLRLLLSTFLILISQSSIHSQVLNGESYNYDLRVEKYYFGNITANFFRSFILGIRTDSDCENTLLLTTTGILDNGLASTGRFFHQYGAGNYSTPNPLTRILDGTNSTSSKFDFTVVSFNWAQNGVSVHSRYQTQFGDKNPGRFTTLRDFTTEEGSSKWNSRWHNGTALFGTVTEEVDDVNSLRSVKVGAAWRYYHGDGPYETGNKSGALQFGTLSMHETKYHINSNRRKPTGALEAMGYRNQWTSTYSDNTTNSPDVTYSFELLENADVVLSTDYPETNFDTRIHLVKADPTMNTNGEVLQSSLDISNDNNRSALVQNLEAGEYWIVVEGNQDDASGAGDFKLSVAVVSGFADQGVANPNSFVKHNGKFICPMTSLSAPSSPDVIEYQWESKPSAEGEEAWTDMFEGNVELLTGIGSNPILPLDLRRRMTSAGVTLYSDVLQFNAFAGTSIITGKVTGPPATGSQGIEGVWVFAVPTEEIAARCSTLPDSAMTDINGEYTLQNIVYEDGETAGYDIYAEYLDHEFDPDTIHNKIVSNGVNPSGQNFVDNTAVFIKGKVFQETGGEECGLPGVTLTVPSLGVTAETDSLGEYSLAVQVGNFDVVASYVDETHIFSPPIQENITVTTEVTDINFESTTTHTISGTVTACGNESMGVVEIKIEDVHDPKCYTFFETTDLDGSFSIEVPARNYLLSVTDNGAGLKPNFDAEAISNFFSDTIFANVAVSDTSYQLIYRQDPLVFIQAATDSTGFQQRGSCSDQYVVSQGEITEIVFEIIEENTLSCPLDTGMLVVIDAISGLDTVVYPISNGIAHHIMRPEAPKLSPFDPEQQIEFYAMTIDSVRQSDKQIMDVIVTGYIPRNTTFSTVSPEIPIMILRDPPGDLSYSELIETETSETSLSFSTLMGGSVTAWAQAKVGVQFEAGFLGFSTESNAWGSIDNSLEVGASNSTDEELVLSMTNVDIIKTDDSGDPDLIGAGGDVFIGSAFNILYAKADVLNFDDETCDTYQTIDLIMGADSIQTEYAYTDFFIRNSEIPRLENLLPLVPADSVWWYEDQIRLWEQTLAINDSLKAIAVNPTNFNFSGSLSKSGEVTKSTTISTQYEFQMEINSELAAEVGFEVAGSGASGGVRVNMRAEFGRGSGNSKLKSRTTKFHLQDDDNTDGYAIVVKECPQYNTPIFEEDASFTSCPYIPGTNQRDKPVLTVIDPIRINADPNPGSGQEFTFIIANNSESDDERNYMFDIIDASNTNAAKIIPLEAGPIGPFPIPAFDPNDPDANKVPLTIVIEKFPSISTYSYEDLMFVAYPECESSADFVEESASIASVSVFFESPCSQIELVSPDPQDFWQASAADNNTIPITFSRASIGNLDSVAMEYKFTSSANWNTGFTVMESELAPGMTSTVNWEIENIPDGEYTIRMKLYCSAGKVHSERASGIIDRQGPIVYGIPSPIDDIYNLSENDVISVSYEEDINCGTATVLLEDMETGEPIDAILSCVDNQALITPIQNLESRGPAIYRVTVSGIEDDYGNVSVDYKWAFIVGDYEFIPNCDPINISNNNVNQDAISQSVYHSQAIISDGIIANSTTIGFVAEEQVTLEPGFEVSPGAVLTVNIDDCPN